MKKIVSNSLYILFFGFALLLVIACVQLIVNLSKGVEQSYYDIEAVQISDGGDDDIKYAQVALRVDGADSANASSAYLQNGFKSLTDERQAYLYEKLTDSIYSISDEADENGRYRISRIKVKNKKMSEFEIRQVVNAFVFDHPEVFWIENLFGYAYSDEDTIVEFYSVLSARDCERYIVVFNDKVDSMMAQLTPDMTEYQKEKKLHDLLLEICSYKTGVSSSADGWQYFTSYGAVVDGEAVCEGYAKSMQMLLTKAGIPCGMIRGDADGVAHMWNVVELAGEWYHLDPTWDDNDAEGIINYEYFNLTTESISRNHVICSDISTVTQTDNSEEPDPLVKYNFYVPLCTKKDMNYYYAEGVFIEKCDGSADEALIKSIADRAKQHEDYVPIRLGTKLSFTDYVNKLFYETPYEFYYCLESANAKLSEKDKLDMGNISFLKNESEMTIRVRIRYQNERTEAQDKVSQAA